MKSSTHNCGLHAHLNTWAKYRKYTPLQKYWNSEANSFIFAVDWKHLGLTSKDEYQKEISISAFISRYSYLDLINNLEDSTFCLNPPIFHVSKSIATDATTFMVLLKLDIVNHCIFRLILTHHHCMVERCFRILKTFSFCISWKKSSKQVWN